MIRKTILGVLFLVLLVAVASLLSRDVRRFVTLYADGSSDALAVVDLADLTTEEQAAYYFLQGDFGALSTNTLRGSATPWALTATVITLDYVDGDRSRLNRENMAAAFRQWGITSAENVANWPNSLPAPKLTAPIGISTGLVQRHLPSIQVTAANFNCAICHSSVVFDADGQPDPSTVWIGPPNGSINLEAYPQAIYNGFLKYGQAPDLMDQVKRLFPDISDQEIKTLKSFVLPRAVKRIGELADTTKRAVPFKGGYPGLTNGFDALQVRLGVTHPTDKIEISAFNSIPNLEDHQMRTSFLNAASYEIPGLDPRKEMTRADVSEEHLDRLGAIVAYFTIPSMGLDFETAREQIPVAQKIMRLIAEYETPAFPGEIDFTLLEQGGNIYARHCASCHGTFENTADGTVLTSFPNYVGDVGTDSLRLSILTDEFSKAVNASSMSEHIHAPKIRGYSAPSLSGIWLSAPYFHNGSVPTLWAVMNPELRPQNFPIGGHRLDYEKVGIDLLIDDQGVAQYPPDYEPWSLPVRVDTKQTGLSNSGHEAPFDELSQDEKMALLEYLKTL